MIEATLAHPKFPSWIREREPSEKILFQLSV